MSIWKFYLILLALSFSACAVQPDAGSEGKCNLDCSSTAIGSAAGIGIKTITNDYTLNCGVVTTPFSLGRPITVKFKIFNEQGGDVFDPGTTDGEFNNEIPITNISFSPEILGARDACATSTDVATVSGSAGNCTVDPFEYHGIVTPRAEWCSDSCGVASVEYVPVCLTQSHEIATTLISGSAVGDDAIQTVTMDATAPTD